jgi:hypothetical protein
MQLLHSIFQHQARSVASMIRLDGEAPDLTPWIAATANAVKPLLLQMAQLGIIQSQRRIAAKVRGHSVADTRRHTVGNDAAFKCLKGVMWNGSYRKPVSRSIRQSTNVTKAAVSKTSRFNAGNRINKPTVRFDFNIFDPRVADAIDAAAFAFCRETTATAHDDLATALAELRAGMKRGLSEGQAQAWIAAKVGEIFASPMRAFRIATTESSRAVHTGQFMNAKESGVTHKAWVSSPDCCDFCQELTDKGPIPLDKPFYVDPKGGVYAIVMFPPCHPHDMCSWEEIVDYGRMAA